VTYIELINRFWKIEQQVAFTAYEAKLYFAILKIANDTYWKHDVLSIPNSKIIGLVSCSRKTLIKSRQRLEQHNLIEFTPGHNKIAAPKYKIIHSTCVNSTRVDSTRVKIPRKFPQNYPHIKDKDKDKYKYGEIEKNEKLHDGSEEVYEFFKSNFNNSDKLISRLKNEYALGKDFVDFMLYLLDKGLSDAIANSDNPVGFVMHFAHKPRDWVDYQTWQSERYKREGDAVDRYRTQSYSYNSVR